MLANLYSTSNRFSSDFVTVFVNRKGDKAHMSIESFANKAFVAVHIWLKRTDSVIPCDLAEFLVAFVEKERSSNAEAHTIQSLAVPKPITISFSEALNGRAEVSLDETLAAHLPKYLRASSRCVFVSGFIESFQ